MRKLFHQQKQKPYMWLDLTKPGFDAQNYIKRYGDFKY